MNNESFEQLLQKLEGIAKDLENKEIPLEVAVAKYQEGIALSKKLHDLLSAAEKLIVEVKGE